jgi:hypothetical protein
MQIFYTYMNTLNLNLNLGEGRDIYVKIGA